MSLPASFTTVTPLSKTIALILVVLLPVGGFFFGRYYESQTRPTTSTPVVTSSAVPNSYP